MTAPTPTLDRFTADALRIAAERQAELITTEFDNEGNDPVAELAWKAAEAAVPTIPTAEEVEANLDIAEEIIESITEAFVELARICLSLEGDEPPIRLIMAVEAVRRSEADLEAHQLLVQEAVKARDLAALEANVLGGFHAFRNSVLFFIVNTQPGGTLDAAFDLILGLDYEDPEDLTS